MCSLPARGERMKTQQPCPFCSLGPDRVVRESRLTFTIHDNYPVSPGHLLVIPKRHVASFFDLTAEEQAEVLAAVHEAKHLLDLERHPDGFNIGVNVGMAAGQTVMHGSDHALPRFLGRAQRDRRPDVEATKSSPSRGMPPRAARSPTRGTAWSSPHDATGRMPHLRIPEFTDGRTVSRMNTWRRTPVQLENAACTGYAPAIACEGRAGECLTPERNGCDC